MQYNKAAAAKLNQLFDVTARVRNRAPIDHLVGDGTAAHLCFVDVTKSVGGQKLDTISFVAKILPNAGRFLDLQEVQGSDGQFRPLARISNELRAVYTRAAFALPQVRELAEKYERLIAGEAEAPQQSDQVAALLAEIAELRALVTGQAQDEPEESDEPGDEPDWADDIPF